MGFPIEALRMRNAGPSEPAWSGAPGYIGSGAYTAVNGDVTFSVPYPSDIQYHDILILHLIGYEGTAGAPIYDTPTGWTLLNTGDINGTTTVPQWVFWKRAVGTESGSETLTATVCNASSDAKIGIMSNYRGCLATGTPYEGVAATAGNSTNPPGSAVTTTGADRKVVNLIAKISGNANLGITPGSGFTEQYDNGGITAGGKTHGMALHEKTVASASTEPAETTTASAVRYRVLSFALMPR